MTALCLEPPATTAGATAVDVAPPAVVLPPDTPLLRRLGKHPRLMHYNRLIAGVLAANAGLAWWGFDRGGWWSAAGIDLAAFSYAALANFALAILVRQQYVINLLFWLATRAPTRWPLKIRWTLAKVYHFGGLHVGGAVAGTLWFLTFVAALTVQALRDPGGLAAGPLVASYALVALLLVMVATAVPPFRARHHDVFEKMHRFGGWTALVLFWTQTVLFELSRHDAVPASTGTAAPGAVGTVPSSSLDTAPSGSAGAALSGSDAVAAVLAAPAVWVLVVITVSIALPWLRLRRVPVEITRPSSHVALVRFDHGVTPFAGSSTAVSRSPLLEWHSFANVPSPYEASFRLTISRAGDWTASFIDDAPSHVWVKGITTAGVANIETLFTKVVYVATGSGIGPVLPHLLAGRVPARLVWATRSPRATYGDALIDEILAVQPDALIWDTALRGKPDMVRLGYAAYADFKAEAVICISNKKLTWQVVHGLERRGIPAYGAIWDS